MLVTEELINTSLAQVLTKKQNWNFRLLPNASSTPLERVKYDEETDEETLATVKM